MKKALFLIPFPLFGQEMLPEVVVTASRYEQNLEDVPYTTEILTAADLVEQASRTLPQAFLNTPGVLVQQTTPGHGSPYIRGFTGRQNLLLQDGIRLNNSTWRGGPVQYWNTLDVQAIDRIEIVKSQGSVLYGSDAIGGTVNTFSKSSGFRNESGFFASGSASYRIDSNSESHLGRLEQRLGVGGQWGLTLGISASDIGDIRDSALGTMEGTGYSQLSHDLKFEYALSDRQTLTLAHSYLDQDDISRWHNTVNNPGWVHGRSFTTPGTDLARDYDQERSLTYLRFEDRAANFSWIDSYEATLSYQKTQDSTSRVRGNGRSDSGLIDLETYGLTFQADSNHVVWGVDYYHDEVDSKGFRNGAPRPSNRSVADGSSYDSLGFFANYSGELGSRFRYDAGVRYTYIEAQWDGYRPDGTVVDQSGDGAWDDFSFSLRGQYDLTKTWSLFGGASQAFRAPNLNDLTGSTFSLNGLNSNGSPDVDPEDYLTTEMGIRHQSGDLFFQTAGFYTFIDDGIISIDDGNGGLVATNGSEGYLYGFEAKLVWSFHPRWRLLAHAAWQDGKQRQGGVEDTIRRLLPLSGSVDLRWTAPSEKYWVSGRLQAATRQDNLSASAADDTQRIPVNGTPEYVVASLYSGWQVSESLQLNLALENLFDQDYRIHGSGQNMPGRNATLSINYEW